MKKLILKFTPEQEARIREAEQKEKRQEARRQKRMQRTITKEVKILEVRLRRMHRLNGNGQLRLEIAQFLAPLLFKMRYKAVGAFVSQH